MPVTRDALHGGEDTSPATRDALHGGEEACTALMVLDHGVFGRPGRGSILSNVC
ncbi:MAG TPA: hypothetical protein VH643_34535 [Gemmataceae bacterium]|jgi:hypothetical protein